MKKQVSLFLVLCISIAFIATGCGTASKSTDTNTSQAVTAEVSTSAADQSTVAAPKISGALTVINNRVDQVDNLNKIAAAFHEKYPDATVVFEAIKDWQTTEKVRLASGAASDLMMADYSVVPTRVQLGDFFLPIDDLGYTKDTTAFYDTFSNEGIHYALVDSVMVTGLLYSKKTLANAGIAEAPKTLDELFADCDKLKSKGILPMGSMVKSKWPLYNWCAVRNAYETATTAEEYYSQYTTSDAPFTKDSPFGKELAFIKSIKDKGYFDTSPASSDWDVLRLQMDKVGFLYLANYGIGALANEKPEDIGFSPLPIDNSGKIYASLMSGAAYGISKDTKSPDAAKAFLKFWNEESKFNDILGMLPAVKSVTSGVPQLAEFMATNPILFEEPTPTDEFSKIINKAQISQRFEEIAQDVIISGEIDKTLEINNKKWADARKAVVK